MYFLATKLLRDKGKGPTILISPLLALMRNQLETAKKLGLRSATVNSDNQSEWNEVKEAFSEGEIDILLISPERLFSHSFRDVMVHMQDNIGMFVVDEAHCVSDWGHDFRPDYRRIVNVLKSMPSNIPVLATTATANDRVIADLKEQIGHDLHVIRGPLTRDSLRIQVVDNLKRQEERLAWLAENLPRMEGSGIIYCLTRSDCRRVSDWLQTQKIHAQMYVGGADVNQELEQKLLQNEIKVLVATNALGMGFDKGDLGFVIHYQSPGSIVAYYQQIGRAGRNLQQADVILLTGEEDEGIHQFFIESAFPNEQDLNVVLHALENAETDITATQLERTVNLKNAKIEKCLKFLEVDGAVVRVSPKKFSRSFKTWSLDRERVSRVTQTRLQELDQMNTLINTDECYMQFVAEALDDFTAGDCGRCTNCTHSLLYSTNTSQKVRQEALEFLRGDALPIKIRKQWPSKQRIPEIQRTQQGWALCRYGDSVYGAQVAEDKYNRGPFRDELVGAMAKLIMNKIELSADVWVTCVPSRRSGGLVPAFAKKVANALGLEFRDILIKVKDTPPQKEMENSAQQATNVHEAFEVHGDVPTGPVLLIDDIVDSAWTFTECGVELVLAGSGPVYPFALATAGSSGGDSD